MKKLFIILGVIFIFACEQSEDESNKTLLVKVGNEKLFLEDFDEMIPYGASKNDSTEIVNHHIDKWIKETLFRREASKQSDNDQINEMVEIYRNSLLVHDYENRILEENLDSLISKEELQSTYLEHKEDFILSEPAYLIFYVEAAREDGNEFSDMWKEKEWETIDSLCKLKTYKHFIKDSIWMTPAQADKYLDEDIIAKVEFERGYYSFNRIGDIQFFFQVRDIMKPGKQAPLSVVDERVRKLILHKRARTLLEKEKTDLYQEAISGNSIVKYSENSE